MKKIITFHVLAITTQFCFAQPEFSFSQGEAKQSNYFACIPYAYNNGMIVVKVSLHGKLYRFILDTGASTVISSSLYNTLKPTVLTKLPMGDISGIIDNMTVVSVKEITIGDIIFTDIPAVVAGENWFIHDCWQVDGLIGSNLLRNSIVQFSSMDNTIIITNDAHKLTLNQKHSSALYLNIDSYPYIQVKLRNKKSVKEFLLFDSGMAGFYSASMSHMTVRKLRILEILGVSRGNNAWGFHGVVRDTVHYKLLLPSMKMNNTTFRNISALSIYDDSRIGNTLLAYGIVTVDYKNRKFYFTPFFDLVQDLHEKHFPVDFIPRHNHLYIGFVWDTTLDDQVSVGDQILAIDGTNYENITLCDVIEKKSYFKAKEKMTLTLKNTDGAITELVIERK